MLNIISSGNILHGQKRGLNFATICAKVAKWGCEMDENSGNHEPKRGRGRPRKIKTESETPKEPKKRGRPRVRDPIVRGPMGRP
jgi:hypothetical protein